MPNVARSSDPSSSTGGTDGGGGGGGGGGSSSDTPGNGGSTDGGGGAWTDFNRLNFRVHANSRLDTLAASRCVNKESLGEKAAAAENEEGRRHRHQYHRQHHVVKAPPAAVVLLNKPDEHVLFGKGLEEPYLLALTADRILAFVYDDLSEPRSFKAPLNHGKVGHDNDT